MDHLPDHIFVKDTRSRFVTANAATVHTLGAKALEEVLGKTDFDFCRKSWPSSSTPTNRTWCAAAKPCSTARSC